ncbi:hypothetical protein [Lentzea sp. NPDC003310]|uniref:hypothetical protein n=1 Tax=Lentzea sp. NPDC003310 TaxID=3154447 RepID=UPI0033BF2E04
MTDVRAEVARLYERQSRMPYPRGLSGAEVAGVEMTELDISALSWVGAWVERGGEPEDDMIAHLTRSLGDLQRVVPFFADPASDGYRPYTALYYGRLLVLVRLVVLELVAAVTRHADPSGPL